MLRSNLSVLGGTVFPAAILLRILSLTRQAYILKGRGEAVWISKLNDPQNEWPWKDLYHSVHYALSKQCRIWFEGIWKLQGPVPWLARMMLEKIQALTQTKAYIDIVLRHGSAPPCRTCSDSPAKTAGGERRSKLELLKEIINVLIDLIRLLLIEEMPYSFHYD